MIPSPKFGRDHRLTIKVSDSEWVVLLTAVSALDVLMASAEPPPRAPRGARGVGDGRQPQYSLATRETENKERFKGVWIDKRAQR
jgi:hypothetical protein